MHIVFPYLYVTQEMALYITAAMIARLTTERLPCGQGAWSTCVDQQVYGEGRGLRWAWQVKDKVCDACGGKDASMCRKCGVCQGRGRVADRLASMYTPRARLVDGGALQDKRLLQSLRGPTVELLLEASVRGTETVLEPTPGWRLYQGAPPLPLLRTRRDGAVEVFADAGQAALSRSRQPEALLDLDDPRMGVLQKLVRRQREQYASVVVSKVRLVHKGVHARLGYRVFVCGHGATYCANKRSYHSRSSVKFWVTENGIVQECHSAHKYGPDGTKPCSSFSSPQVPLTVDERAVLYPGGGGGAGPARGAAGGRGRKAARTGGHAGDEGGHAGDEGGGGGGGGGGLAGAGGPGGGPVAAYFAGAPVAENEWRSLGISGTPDACTTAELTGTTPKDKQVNKLAQVLSLASLQRRVLAKTLGFAASSIGAGGVATAMLNLRAQQGARDGSAHGKGGGGGVVSAHGGAGGGGSGGGSLSNAFAFA